MVGLWHWIALIAGEYHIFAGRSESSNPKNQPIQYAPCMEYLPT
jgi:hypothetical protein